jgi:hypothetical protein
MLKQHKISEGTVKVGREELTEPRTQKCQSPPVRLKLDTNIPEAIE